MTIDILCRVVDNLGDIGFVYRLARSLSELPEAPQLRLIVDDLSSFALICPEVNAEASFQEVEHWAVVRWDEPGEDALSLFRSNPPRKVIECYACGRPPWFESLLFDESDTTPRCIVNLEYLTAESWARDFHTLPSLTRSPLVRKAIFMPGFQEGTGGLLQDATFCASLEAHDSAKSALALRTHLLPSTFLGFESSFWVLIFSYEHDFTPIVADLAVFNTEKPLLAIVAAGRSAAPFLEAWKKAGRPFPVLVLPQLRQQEWDTFLIAADFSLIRGEESFSRACLAGHPFLWQCYPFAETTAVNPSLVAPETSVATGHLPKVYAFLELIKPYLRPDHFITYQRLTLHFNGVGDVASGDLLAVLRAVKPPLAEENGAFSSGFRVWAKEVRDLGNLAAKVLTFIHEME